MKIILLIEDDKVMRENTAEILELARYSVTTAKDGKEGVELAKKIRPDLIISDIMMPKLDGYGVLHILAKEPETARIPFIFLTAKAEKSELRKGMELGADDYLTKPFEETELLNAIEARLRKHGLIRKEFVKDMEGLNQFLDAVGGMEPLITLSKARSTICFKRKETIFHEGDSPQFLFFLHHGKIKSYKTHDDGKEYVTSLHKNGDFFGYIPLLKNTEYSESAVALENSEVCKIPKADFMTLVYKNRDIAAKFISMLAGNIMDREQQLLSLAYDTVRKRIAETLLKIEARYREGSKKNFRMTINRDDLASMAGTATETVIRSLSEFKAGKLIEIDGREIVIVDLEGLQEIQ